MAQGVSDMGFAGAAGAGDEHGRFFLNELVRGQIADEFLIDFGIEVKIKFSMRLVPLKLAC